MQAADQVASSVSEQRQWSLLMALARIGGLENGGVDRQALTDLDAVAKNFVADWAARRGFSVFQDEAANLFVRMEGREPGLAPLMAGSHLDTQPTGGKFDGAYGVVAGLECLEAMRDAGLRPKRSIEVVSWMNEEGSRFSPGACGSATFAGTRPMSSWVNGVTADGAAVAAELARSLAATEAAPRAMAAVRPSAYLEAHIEQGPVLEQEGLAACAVDSVQGQRRFAVELRGRTAHAGTTPRALRKDALVAATRAMTALHGLAEAGDAALRLTIGRIEALPNSPNTVPDFVRFSIDLRHPDGRVLDEAEAAIMAIASGRIADCAVEARRISAVPPTPFDPRLVDMLEDAAASEGLAKRRMASGAGHDAMHLARICPTAMVFVRCRDGLSHHPDESASAHDLAVGTRMLVRAAWRLAEQA